MIFFIKHSKLQEVLTIASRALSNKTPMPIYSGIKLEAEYEKLIITTSNGNISMQITIDNEDIKIEKPGTVVVPGRYFTEIIKKLNAEDISITVIENNLINIKANLSDFTLNCMDAELYPEIVFNTMSNPIIINAHELKNIIRQTNFAASVFENRPILTGVLYSLDGYKLTVTATDSYRLAKKEVNLNINHDRKEIVIPKRTLEELWKILNINSKIELYISEGSLITKFNNVMMQSRLLEGKFPETSKLIPTEFPIQVSFNKDELIESIERASLLNQIGKDSIVKLKLNKEGMAEISSHSSEIGKVVEKIKTTSITNSDEFNIAFSSKYVVEALKIFESSEISILFTGVVKPFIIKGALDEEMLQLILPVRVE